MGSKGVAYFSCPQLEEGSVPNRVNLLQNGDFSYTTTNKQNSDYDREFPDYWTKGDGITTAYRSRVISPHDMELGLPEVVHGKALQLYSRPHRGAVWKDEPA